MIHSALSVKRILNYFSFVIPVCFLIPQAKATHIVGGELNYRSLGNNNYEIRLTVFRDCFHGQAPFDDPASIGIFNSGNVLVGSSDVYITDQESVPNVINSPCLTPPTNVCYEVAHYIFTTNLPPRPGGYQLVYQRCCRNNTIINLQNVASTGATYFATIPDPGITTVNSNPVFTHLPPTFLCVGAPFTFDHSAIDADGDSLVYQVCVPLSGATPGMPMPQPPNNPPYAPVVFAPPYNIANEIGGTALTIDPHTGLMHVTPASTGQFVYGICVKEYRNGLYLGVTWRDFQVNVIPCPQITVASILSPTISCGNLIANFTNNSYHAVAYSWNFGDTSTTQDTSTLQSPSWNYPDTGDYMATLIAYSGVNSLCNDTAQGLVHVYPVFYTDYIFNNSHCDPAFSFTDQSAGINGLANYWVWNFGDGKYSTLQNPNHTYLNPGTYNVTLISSTDSACNDTATHRITVLQLPTASFSTVLDTCKYKVGIQNSSQHTDIYHWQFGDAIQDTVLSPVHDYSTYGNYSVSLVALTDSGCSDTTSVNISIPPLPVADFSYTVPRCDSVVTFTNHSQNAVAYQWKFGDDSTSDVPSLQHLYTISGNIPVSLVTTSASGCKDTINKNVYFVSFKEANFDYFLDTCSGLVLFKDVTPNAASYFWNFGDGETSTNKNPIHHYPRDGDYKVMLSLNRETVCADSAIERTVYETPLGELLYVPDAFTPNGDGLNDFFQISTFRPCDVYTLTIFNRWGQQIYQADDAAFAKWDGTFDGRQIEQGVYIYLLKGGGQERKGIVTVIR